MKADRNSALWSKTVWPGLILAVAAVALSGCRGGGGSGTGTGAPHSAADRPVQLGPNAAGGGGAGGGIGVGASAALPLDEAALARAIENYRINKKRARSDYRSAGVDLDGDGVAEAIVLFKGKDWCAANGCSLAIFKSGPRGYRPAFRTVRVKAPVMVSRDASNGWRDLLVWTGGAGTAPKRRVLLRNSGTGYPRNAMLEPEVPLGSAIETQVVIDAASAAASSAQGAPGSNP
ncbi:MAG: hypothetical protein MI824_03940 [Hyphomicrobiales bacterium]|nr:hypothetical protein [Hyphomicrobiales bacterium]